MLEKERKFILTDEAILKELTPTKIKQGYLMLGGKGKQLRIRLMNNCRAFMCYKYDVSKTEKQEFEYEIEYSEGCLLYDSTDIKIEKTRYTIIKGIDLCIDIDIFDNGVKVVELEYFDVLKPEWIPEYCGLEVTGNPQYSNIAMAIANKPRTVNGQVDWK